jgi:hypothetical protein
MISSLTDWACCSVIDRLRIKAFNFVHRFAHVCRPVVVGSRFSPDKLTKSETCSKYNWQRPAVSARAMSDLHPQNPISMCQPQPKMGEMA